MTRRRSSWAAVAALAMTLTLAACGRDDEGGSGASGASQAAEVDFSTASGEISVWAMGTEGDNLGVLAEDFMAEYPDVSVEVTAVPWDAAHDRIVDRHRRRRGSRRQPDRDDVDGRVRLGGGLDPTPANIDPSIFFEGAWDTTVVDGMSYGVPWYVETRLVYYRTDLAEEGGATAPPANWDELKGLAEATATRAPSSAISLQPGGQGSWQTFMPFFWQAGGEIVDEAGNFTLDSEACVEALTYYDSFFEEGLAAHRGPGAVPVESAVRRRRGRLVHQRAVDDRHRHRRGCRPGHVDGGPPADRGGGHVVRRRRQPRRLRDSRQQDGRLGVRRVPVAARRCRSRGTRR